MTHHLVYQIAYKQIACQVLYYPVGSMRDWTEIVDNLKTDVVVAGDDSSSTCGRGGERAKFARQMPTSFSIAPSPASVRGENQA